MSKDAKFVLYHLYKEYLLRRENHIPKSKAKCFDSAEFIHDTIFPDLNLDDLVESLRELGRNGFLYNSYACDSVYSCEITDDAIVVMENQKKDTLLNVLDFISKFIP